MSSKGFSNWILNKIANVFSTIINLQSSKFFSYFIKLLLICWLFFLYSLEKWIFFSSIILNIIVYYILPIIIFFYGLMIILLVLLQRGYDGVFSQSINENHVDSDTMSIYTVNIAFLFFSHVILNSILFIRVFYR